jgi:putative tryptophan/tyrosine transport system substrate-binding protein
MRRREFLATLAGAGAAWPVSVRAQGAVPTVGVLALGNLDPEIFMRALRQGLRELGYVEGQNVRLELRSAGGDTAALPGLAADLVGRGVDVIVAWQTPPALAAKRATAAIPIVMAGAGDPLSTGLVASLARPGGNVTGTSGIVTDFIAKVVGLVRETLPAARRLAILAHATDPFTAPFVAQIERAARSQDIAAEPVMLRPSEPFEAAFEIMRRRQSDAVIVQGSMHRPAVAGLALKHRLPSFSNLRELPVSGGLMSYGAIASDSWRGAAAYVDRILKGARPGELPVSQPTRFELVINRRTADALGVPIPPSLLARADEVIE